MPQEGFAFRAIWISGFHRRQLLSNILLPAKVIVGMAQALSIVRKFSPAVVVGTGGYVSGPVVYAATLLGIPTVIQDQNGAPGATTKFLSGKVNEVHLTFESSKRFLRRQDNILVSGNPTRDALDNADERAAAEYFGFDPADERNALLVFGGSLGAASVNAAVRNALPEIMKRNLRLIWQTGTGGFDAAVFCGPRVRSGLALHPQVHRPDGVCVCGKHAGSLPGGRNDDCGADQDRQTGNPRPVSVRRREPPGENARLLADAGAAVMVTDDRIAAELLPLLDRCSATTAD